MDAKEFPAMVYKNNRNKTFIANCMMKNLVGFGRTEEDALNSLKESLEKSIEGCEVILKPMYGFSIAQ